ncbi:MAG TPA: glutathione peroxidase [Bacillota bacterium]|nr:glutathione peroxidase [Bacillota bacterium]
MNLYDIQVKKMDGTSITLNQYKGKVLLIVNTASKCGFTPQFKGLEELYQTYKDKDFVILGFPCNQFLHQDPGTDKEILEFCQLNYGVTFPMFSKIDVRGKSQHELYQYLISKSPVLTGKSIKWNFEKFLVDKNGEIVNRFISKVTPKEIASSIEELI